MCCFTDTTALYGLPESQSHSHSHSYFSFRRKSSGGEESGLSHFRRASEKVKKKMKMPDLRAFVETKLLSKSEKTLEKIGRDDAAKPLDEQVRRCDPSPVYPTYPVYRAWNSRI